MVDRGIDVEEMTVMKEVIGVVVEEMTLAGSAGTTVSVTRMADTGIASLD